MISKIYKFLSSAKLAMALLVVILACCVVGVTVVRGERAWVLIFSTLWFNGLLVLLVVNVACCFFPRMWGRKLTLISFGMILFHLSFVAILTGIVYNSFFYFRGLIRLTEGETLPSGQPQSYDVIDQGRFFDFSKLKGETTLLRMHTGYRIDDADKRSAYEIAVGEEGAKKQGIIYITENLDHNGVTYLNDREGYSVLVMLSDKDGKDLYGAHVPLQSQKQADNSYLYTTGTAHSPGSFPYPQGPLKPLFMLQVVYRPDPSVERAGEVFFTLWKLEKTDEKQEEVPFAEGKAAVGERVDVGDYYLYAGEIRYWVGMAVRYEPGKPIVLGSLWVGFAGIVLTFIGRIIRARN